MKQKTIIHVDGNNFFAGCEIMMNPALKGRAVCVLSNNDGCVVARSYEAKKMGIPMGIPYFMAKNQFKNVVYLSADFSLYNEISSRMMQLLYRYSDKVDIYSIEDLRQLVFSLKEATEYKKPVIVKVAAVHNIAAIASGIARSGADIIAIDGFRGGTGAAPTRIRDNVGIPIELALAAVDQRLRDEGIRNNVSLIVGGSIRSAADVVKAIALGADACYVATAALLALGCHLCRTCQSGKCNWGIATQKPELVKRLNPEIGSERLVNLMTAWKHEIKELMGGMGINSIEALRGNRLMLRGIGLTEKELEILGISHAGE